MLNLFQFFSIYINFFTFASCHKMFPPLVNAWSISLRLLTVKNTIWCLFTFSSLMSPFPPLSPSLSLFQPEYKVADPICTFMFSVFVLCTTVTILRDVFRILLEGIALVAPSDFNERDCRGINIPQRRDFPWKCSEIQFLQAAVRWLHSKRPSSATTQLHIVATQSSNSLPVTC